MTAQTPAGRLASKFGDVAAMSALYADDVTWKISESLGIPFMEGRDAVIAFNRQVWTDHHRPDCTVTILDEVGDDVSSAVRFTYRAWSFYKSKWYENEYTLFVRGGPSGIQSVVEAMDSSANLDFLLGQPIGHAWNLLGGEVGEAVDTLGRAEQ